MEVKCFKWTQERGTRNQIVNQRNQWSKCQHPLDHRKKQKNSRKKTSISFFFIDYPKVLIVWVTTNWKILKEMWVLDHLIWLLRNLYACQETTVRTIRGTTDWFKIGKGVHQSCIVSPCLFNFYAEYIIQNAGLDKS